MFNKEIILKQLKEIHADSGNIKNWSNEKWDLVLNSYIEQEGFYIFRVLDNAYFFIENTLIDCCPGYFNIPKIERK